jgi:transcriptional regulator with XRE-family HTH domain
MDMRILSISNYAFLAILGIMGFKENLKAELVYSGMMVKELSAVTGIKKHTLDNYLNTHNSIPSAEAAVSIAQALGVTVEYLITGHEGQRNKTISALSPNLRFLLNEAEKLTPKNQKLAIKLVKALKEQEDEGKI